LVRPVRTTDAVEPDPVVVVLPLPDKLILPPEGVTTVKSSVVNVFKSPDDPPRKAQLADTTFEDEEKFVSVYSLPATVLIHLLPSGHCTSVELGARD
jgi:hypothetical protein